MELLRAISARTFASRLAVCSLPVACCLLLTGCQNSGRQMQTDLYQRELRLQEDEIYRLEDYIEEYQGIISGYRCEIDELKRELASSQSDRAASPTRPRSESVQLSPRTKEESSLLTTPEPTDFDSSSSEPLPPGSDTPAEEAPTFKPGGAREDVPAIESLDEAPAFEGAAIDDRRASQIAATPREPALLQPISATLPANQLREETPPNPYPTAIAAQQHAVEPAPETIGDPSLRVTAEATDDTATISVIVEANESDALRRFNGTVSVMLTDPTEQEGVSKRIARWDFTEAEVRDAMQSDTAGLRLTIALPAETPTDRPLRLWVRMVDRSGQRKLQATSVRFLAEPLRLIENESLADSGSMHRLPAAENGHSRDAVVQTNANGWRTPDRNAADRRVDSAVAPASYEAW